MHHTNGKYFNCTFNLSTMDKNNNKFYKMQVLVDRDNPSTYYLFKHWGRVGEPGNFAKKPFKDLKSAEIEYQDRFRNRKQMGYFEIIIKYDDEAEEPSQQLPLKKPLRMGSTLANSVQSLMSLIFDV